MPSTEPVPTVAELVSAASGSPNGAAPSGALQGSANQYGDGRSGSIYNHVAGPAAILSHREALRDRDLFRDTYFDSAAGWALTRLVQGRTAAAFPPNGIQRILDTFGQGTLTWQRSSSAAGAGQILQGTRVQIPGPTPFVYQVAADTTVNGLQCSVPVEATVLGTGQAINYTNNVSGPPIQQLDPTYDPLWTPVSIVVADGTSFEAAEDYRARVRRTEFDNRKGYITEITNACLSVGAAYVVPFASNFGLPATIFTDDDTQVVVTVSVFLSSPTTLTFPAPHGLQSGAYVSFQDQGFRFFSPSQNAPIGLFPAPTYPVTVVSDNVVSIPFTGLVSPFLPPFVNLTSGARADYGLNAIYVADQNHQSSNALIDAVTVILENYRCIGDDLWVGGIAQTPVELVAIVTLTDNPGRLPLTNIRRSLTQAMLGYFASASTGYAFKRAAIAGAMKQASSYVQTVQWTDTTGGTYPAVGVYIQNVLQTADPTLSSSSFPATLPRYTLAPNDISLFFLPPI